MKKVKDVILWCMIFLLCCPITVFASSGEELSVPEPTVSDYLMVIGVWVASMAVGMIGYYLYNKYKCKKRRSDSVKKSRSKD